jgi:outer membrane translocation and assembly module TamA
VFGRRVTHGSVEYARPLRHTLGGGLSIAGFVDAAQARQRPNGLGQSPLYVDVGVGVRVRAPGGAGAIRFDVARGLRGGGTTLSAGWGRAWPH